MHLNQHLMKEWLRIVEPVVKQRLCDYDERKSGKDVGPEPQDFLPWVVNHGRESGDPNFNEPVTIALRGLIPKSAQIRTSTIDLEKIQEEVRTALSEHGRWTYEAVASMVKVNSFFRETVRLKSFAMIGVQPVVTTKHGITTPDECHLLHGSNTAVPAYSVHHDPEIYASPNEF
ncbi:hypothetical protein SLS63_009151 [Diaporthe eres]|uniref:Uncharacterized protein n=1 Tax=Diaporthe eres TaxID=83184 RepID=A0ABR1P0V5_DIAER